MKFEVPYANITSRDQAYSTVKENITEETIARFKVKADITYQDDSKVIGAKGKGFELKVEFTDDKAIANLDLSFLLKPIKGKIVEGLTKQLSRVL
ncbi:MAG: polyhydroxyalkanoic acid system family protein [Bacteriovoracaceae bacterium]|jgi:hypothetical protein|nr:polyhydroxyalkanoic acid system family protein [Bacteriovoracaceae bacterium]